MDVGVDRDAESQGVSYGVRDSRLLGVGGGVVGGGGGGVFFFKQKTAYDI